MAELRAKDWGFYWCGIYKSSRNSGLRTICLVYPRVSSFPPFVCLSDFLNHKMLGLERTLKITSFNCFIAENYGPFPKVFGWSGAEPAPELRPASFR